MAKITKKQINSIDAAGRNGFSFDRYDFGVLGEKCLSKTITLVEECKAVKLRLSWRDEVVMAALCRPTPATWCRSGAARKSACCQLVGIPQRGVAKGI